jgi:SAM-dependent methyltransferase
MDPTAYDVVHEVEESHWFFVGRRRILARLLDEPLRELDSPQILDIGCGTGATMGFLERYGQVTGIDVSPKAIRYCREQNQSRLCLADGASLPFADRSFDLVTALDLLEHLPQETRGLQEMRRVLKSGGRMILFVPAFMFLWSDFDRFSGHHRRYTRRELRQRVEEAGFDVVKISYFDTFLFPAVWAVRAAENRLSGRRPACSDLDLPSDLFNRLLTSIFSLEASLIDRCSLPFGVSLLCVARKEAVSSVPHERE